jgi:hypothetical protein
MIQFIYMICIQNYTVLSAVLFVGFANFEGMDYVRTGYPNVKT